MHLTRRILYAPRIQRVHSRLVIAREAQRRSNLIKTRSLKESAALKSQFSFTIRVVELGAFALAVHHYVDHVALCGVLGVKNIVLYA